VDIILRGSKVLISKELLYIEKVNNQALYIYIRALSVRVILALTRLHRLGALRGSQGLAEG